MLVSKKMYFFHLYLCIQRAAFHRRSQNQSSTWTYGSQKPALNNNKTGFRNADSKTISHMAVEVDVPVRRIELITVAD
jgi:hypothetical protein